MADVPPDRATTDGQPTGTGNPSEALSAALDAIVSAVKNPPVEPTPDPRITAAFALGWQMAELYRPDAPNRLPAAVHDDLPSLRRLGDQDTRRDGKYLRQRLHLHFARTGGSSGGYCRVEFSAAAG